MPAGYATVGVSEPGGALPPSPAAELRRCAALQAVLGSFVVRTALDWAALITFYTIQSSDLYRAVATATCVGLGAMAVTHVRHCLDPRIASPKVLDVGFVSTFAAFTAVISVDPASASVLGFWARVNVAPVPPSPARTTCAHTSVASRQPHRQTL